ncbi:MAG: histidine phosphatase family protein [Micrococcaceae bacterium]
MVGATMSQEFSKLFNIHEKPKMWIARHGETEWSKSGQYTGRTDLPLTKHGEEQARQAAEKIKGVDFGLVLVSPMQRARKTAELMGIKNYEIDPDAMEWNYGDYEGISAADVRKTNPNYVIWDDGVPHGETIEQVAARADKVIARVKEAGNLNSLVVCHGHFSRILAARWLTMDPHMGKHFLMETAHISIMGWDKKAPAVEKWNG